MSSKIDLTHRYSDIIQRKKVALLGIVPPPLGGVSVHIKRVMHKLCAQNNEVQFFNTEIRGRYKLFPFYLCALAIWLLRVRPEVVICHSPYLSNGPFELTVLAVLKWCMGFQFIVVEHDCRHMFKRWGIMRALLRWCVARVDQYVFIGNKTAASYCTNNVHPPHCSIEGAFLPPDQNEKQAILSTYPPALFTFMREHEPVVLVNAFQLILLHGKDLYGIDQVLVMLKKLHATHPRAGLVCVLGAVGNAPYFVKLKKYIAAAGLQNHVFFLTGQKELWPLFALVDIFIRPTLSDGASVSVQEAVHCGVTTIASDVCARPADVHLYKTSQSSDLHRVILALLVQKNNKVGSCIQSTEWHTGL